LMGFGAGLAVVLAAVVVFARRRRRVMPTVQVICSRCRAPVNRGDAVCRNCGATLYHPYQFYPRRR
jgi:predicted amidophosphoribosyltransferase